MEHIGSNANIDIEMYVVTLDVVRKVEQLQLGAINLIKEAVDQIT